MSKLSQDFIKSRSNLLIAFGWYGFLILWALLQGWGSRFAEHYNDGISYLDMADHFSQGNWLGGLSSWWSPLYPLIIAGFFKLIQPAPIHEFATLKLVNFSIFIGLLLSFECFIRSFIRFYNNQIKETDNIYGLTDSNWLFIGHAVFAYAFLCLNGINIDTPDMLAAALTFIAFFLFLQISLGANTFKDYLLFGLSAGFAYLAKAATLPGMIVCLLLLLKQRHCDKFWPKFALAAVAWLAIICPYIVLLSQHMGELNLFPTGKLNYIWYVQEHVVGVNALSKKDTNGSMVHAIRKIFEKPDAYEFAKPITGTYPTWFDPYYWCQGYPMHICFDWLAITFFCNLIYYSQLFFAACLLVAIVFRLTNKVSIASFHSIMANAPLLIPASIGFLQYSLVINNLAIFPQFINRYFGIFIVLFALGALASLRLRRNSHTIQSFKLGTTLIGIFVFIPMAWHFMSDCKSALVNEQFNHYTVAQQLYSSGLRPGDYIAQIGQEEMEVDWARLARLKIVVDIPNDKDFWTVSTDKRVEILKELKKYNVHVAIYFSQPVAPQSQILWKYLHTSFIHRLLPFLPVYEPLDNPIIPPMKEGWQKLSNLPCWIHTI